VGALPPRKGFWEFELKIMVAVSDRIDGRWSWDALPPNDFAERRESWLSQQKSNSNTKTKSKSFLRREKQKPAQMPGNARLHGRDDEYVYL